MVDIVSQFQEDIVRKLTKAQCPTPLIDVILQMQDEIRTLQNAINEMMVDQQRLVQLMQLNQQIMHGYKARISEFEKKYSDPYMDILNSEQSDE